MVKTLQVQAWMEVPNLHKEMYITMASVRAVWPNRAWQAVSSGLYASTLLQNTYDNTS